jgi:hypothetical protein
MLKVFTDVISARLKHITVMPQVHIVLRKILFNSELFPVLEMVDILAVGFFSTDGVGLFPRRQQRAGCSRRIHFSRVLRKQKTSRDRAATLLYHSLLFPFWGEIAASGKGRRNPSWDVCDLRFKETVT